MDVLRIDTVNGPVHLRPDDIRTFAAYGEDKDKTIVKAAVGPHLLDLIVPCDADEFAQQLETNYPACRVWRIN